MGQLPTNRSANDSDQVHYDDHNLELHVTHNALDDMDTVPLKAVPTSADKLLINDEAASGALKHITIGTLPGGGAGVTTFNTRSGAVVAAASDYDASQIDNDSGVAGATVAAALDTLDGAVAGVASFNTRTGAVVAAASDYDASQIDNDSGVAGATVAAALDSLNSGGGLSLAQGMSARGGPSGVIYSADEWVNVLDYVATANRAGMRAATFDCRGPFQDAWDTGRSVYHPLGRYRITSNFNSYSTGHPVLADLVTAGLQVGLVDRYFGRKLYTEGVMSSGAVGGVNEPLGNINGLTMLLSSLDLAAMVYVDDQVSGSDQRGGTIEGFLFKDISTNQDQILSAIMVGSRWHYTIRNNGFVRIAKDTGTIVPIGSGTTLPNLEDLPGTGIISTTDIPGSETVQYLHIEENIFERCVNGYFMHHDTPDATIFHNMFYGVQKDIAGDSPNTFHNQGTAYFINGLDIQMGFNSAQHTGRGIHIWGRGGKSTAVSLWGESWENPISHGWSAAQRGITYGWIIDGDNIRGVHAYSPVFANGSAVGAPMYVDPSVPDGGFTLENPVWSGLSPTGAVTNNPNNYWLIDTSHRTQGRYSEGGINTPARLHQLNEAGDVVRQEIDGTTETWSTTWTPGD